MTGEETTLAVIDALEGLGVPYMLVGSFSSNYYGIPRSTQDADFVVEFSGMSLSALSDRLGASFRVDRQLSFEGVTGTTRFGAECLENAFVVEMFLLSDDPHDQSRFARRQRVKLFDRESFVPTAEDVIITKLRWFLLAQRAKDRDDLRNVIAVQGDRIELAYVNHWCGLHGTKELLEDIRRSLPRLTP